MCRYLVFALRADTTSNFALGCNKARGPKRLPFTREIRYHGSICGEKKMQEISLTVKNFTFPNRGSGIEVAILSMDIDPPWRFDLRSDPRLCKWASEIEFPYN